MSLTSNVFDFAPFRYSGTVYGTLLNHRAALEALGEAASQPPYKAPPKAPVLYVKPRNTLASGGGTVLLDADVDAMEVGASLALVLGRPANRLGAAVALSAVAGYAVVADLSVPHTSFYRPSLRFKVRDGSCRIGTPVPAEAVGDPDALTVRIWIDDRLAQETSTAGMLCPAACLLADVTDFMTLSAGDILLLGVAAGAPQASRGQRVAIEIDSVGRLDFTLEGAAR